jgi:cytosine/adenosine deaminase-related metal-dependent hydrolase
MSDLCGHVNAHTHLYSGLVPLGMPAPEPKPSGLLDILEKIWWKLDRALDEKILRAAARYYVSEALLAGTSAVIDHHESPDFIEGSLEVLADACQELGLRAVLCYGATERNRGRDEGQAGLEECRRFLHENDRPLVRGVVGLHAAFTVSDELLREAGELCREFNTILHVHLAEGLVDVEDAQKRGWPGPLARLIHFDCLPAGSILAHGVHLDAEQVRRCEERGLWLVQNPRSNAANRVGYPPALASSTHVALGTDGFPSNMPQEERALLQKASEVHEEPGPVAQRLASGHRLIAERFGADPSGRDRAAWSTPDGAHCRSLQVDGRHVVEEGTLLTGDAEEIRDEACEQAARLWQRMVQL